MGLGLCCHLGDSPAARSVFGESLFWLLGTTQEAMALYSWGGVMRDLSLAYFIKKSINVFT